MKRILSIDGGGIRGIIPALVLAEIEKRTNKKIAQMFDLIAGTSTGGILALGFSKAGGDGSAEFSASDLASLYEDQGQTIFNRSLWKGVASVWGVADEKYSHEGIEEVLEKYFADVVLGDALTKVLITSYDIEKRKPFFLKSWRKEYEPIRMRCAARATSAAPTYFEPAQLPFGDEKRSLVDGGVFINNPAVSAYAEARRIFPDESDFLIVSLGTGELTRRIPYEDAKDWGLAGWMLPVLSCMFDGVSDAVNYQLEQILGESFYRFQTTLYSASDDMDNATKGNIENLKSEAHQLIEKQAAKIERVCEKII